MDLPPQREGDCYSARYLQVAELKSQLSKLTSDYEMLTSQHGSTVDENGKLEARIRALQINSQTESDSLAQQVRRTNQ